MRNIQVGELVFWLFIVALVTFGVWIGVANAHSWYDPVCCNDRDCSPVDYNEIQEHGDGSITFRHCNFKANDTRIRWSHDGEWHVCIGPNGPENNATGYCYCIYKPRPVF